MSKRTSFTELTGKKAPAAEEPAAPPVSALLHTITGNPENPRDDNDLDLDELIESFREVGQLQPVLSVSRAVYLRHKPQHAAALGDAQYVTMGGNRRLQAAAALGWARIDILLRDDLGDGEGSLDEAVIIENIHRKNLSPMREAGVLQVLVDRYGSQGKVAKRIGKTQAYVSQRLALLKLEPDLQEAVESGQLKVKEARDLASVPAGRQQAVLEERRQKTTATHNPVIGSGAAGEPTDTSEALDQGVVRPEISAPRTPAVPAQERPSPPPTASAAPSVTIDRGMSLETIAWQDPGAVRELIMEWMDPEPRGALVKMLLADMDEQTA